MRYLAQGFLALFFFSSCSSLNPLREWSLKEQSPKNIIFMIVDGMGFEHVQALRIHNAHKPLAFDAFRCATRVSTCPFEGADSQGRCKSKAREVTDSAASATALATGTKVSNSVISQAFPKDGHNIETILEFLAKQGKSTGVVVTSLITDATPAAFVSHAKDRDLTEEILAGIFKGSLPNVIFGADTAFHRQAAKQASQPYQMIHDKAAMTTLANSIAQGPSCLAPACPRVYGGFGQFDMMPGVYQNLAGFPLEIASEKKFDELKLPHLSQMTDAALKILSKNEKGFFLMVESSQPDMISHYNRQIDQTKGAPKAIVALIQELREVERTVGVLENFVKNNPDTLVVLTADHETGGLAIEADKTACLGQPGCIPEVRWTSDRYSTAYEGASKHTGADVPLFAMGKGAERFCVAKLNNTDIPNLALMEPLNRAK